MILNSDLPEEGSASRSTQLERGGECFFTPPRGISADGIDFIWKRVAIDGVLEPECKGYRFRM
jgi:hypothetical protein